MDLENHYNDLYQTSIEKIKVEGCQTDNLINSYTNKRFGITLLIRPPDSVKEKIQEFIDELKTLDNNQYYYQNSDIHITIMSIISCYKEFHLENISIKDYIKLIEKSIQNIKDFTINFKGITASQSCIMIQGFLDDDNLKNLRNNLRTDFHNSNLEQTIDRRYAIKTAHSTIIRFQNQLTQKKEFLNVLEKYRKFNFGEFKVDNVELVFNDWYQKKEYVKKLHLFSLKNQQNKTRNNKH